MDRAETAIILADYTNPAGSPDDVDARTLLTTLAVETIRPQVYTCVEVLRATNRSHFVRANADELIVSDEMTGALMANSAITHGLSDVVEDLLTHTSGSEFRELRAPAALIGKSFLEAGVALKRTSNIMLVAVAPADKPFEVNPDADAIISGSDRLLVIAAGAASDELQKR
jgi:voltage-gated potassium channel